MQRGKGELIHDLDAVNAWIMNCDQKASSSMAFAGVVTTLLLTSDFVGLLRTYIFLPFINYWTLSSNLCFNFYRCLVFIVLALAFFFIILFFFRMVSVLTSNIDYEKIRNHHPQLPKTSYTFFGSISSMDYETFKKEDFDILEEYRSQLYVNSIIATEKFKIYKKGISFLKIAMCLLTILLVLLMFLN